jgi:hypothetical protein
MVMSVRVQSLDDGLAVNHESRNRGHQQTKKNHPSDEKQFIRPDLSGKHDAGGVRDHVRDQQYGAGAQRSPMTAPVIAMKAI